LLRVPLALQISGCTGVALARISNFSTRIWTQSSQ